MAAPTLLLTVLWTLPLGDASAFATSVALVGDLNGDKASEVLVGSPSDGEENRGRAFVFSGRDGELLRTLDGPSSGSGFGLALDALGDLDGDGFPDFAIGAPYVASDKPNSRAQGLVQLVSGKDGSIFRTLAPLHDELYFGTDLTALDDLEGDKKDDLLVRARVGAGEAEHERFVAFSSATGKRLFAVDSPPGVTSLDLGRPLARLPDADGDGVPDFAVEYGREVHVRSGKDGRHVATFSSSLPDDARSAFGFSICGIPGKPVLVAVGDPREEVHGSIRVIPIVLGEGNEQRAASEKALYLLGDEDYTGVGCSLALAGDVDGDGTPDLVAGLSDGRKGGLMILGTDDLESSRAIEDSPKEGKLPAGWRVASGRDVDGDGTPDVAIARHWPTAGPGAARGVVLVSGRGGRPLREIVSPATEPAAKDPGSPSEPKKPK
ncbi:MAG: integrin alpha [Planctomycetota bacterium]